MYDTLETLATNMFEQYCEQGSIIPWRKPQAISMMCNTVRLAGVTDTRIITDMLRGMCHIFVYGNECKE